jgi:hypothetical protein
MNDSNLIFLISQPRSGSSMLQQLLNTHPRIYSIPEPWFMLPLVYTIKYPGVEADYNSRFAKINFTDYLERFSDGKKQYNQLLRSVALKLYSLAFEGKEEKKYFLDKTPRYYHIIDELIDLFPEAKFILLMRNPLAVFASILDYNFKGDFIQLFEKDRLCDLIDAPHRIASAKKKYLNKIFFVNYENIINNTQSILIDMYNYLELSPVHDTIKYTITPEFRNTTSIDTKSVHKHNRPVSDYLSSWKKNIDNSQKKSIAIDYICDLGGELLNELGYSYDAIMSELKNHKVKEISPIISYSLLVKNSSDSLTLSEKAKLNILLTYKEKGIKGIMDLSFLNI